MVRRIRYIVLLMAVLLMGGAMSEAWADVTYHILTKPFSTKKRPYTSETSPKINVDVNADLVDFRTNIRVEAFRYTSSSSTIVLPDAYKSPLAKNFKFYAATTTSESGKVSKSASREEIWGYNNTTYYLYTINGTSNNEDLPDNDPKLLTEGDDVGALTDIYITYEYDDTKDIKLDGSQDYNIQLGTRMLCLNKDRANRVAGIQESKLADHLDYLSSDEITYLKDGAQSGKNNYFYKFRLKGDDPYNIVIELAYDKGTTFKEKDKNLNKEVQKEYRGATIFSLITNNGETGSNTLWLSSNDHIQWQTSGTDGNAVGVEVPGYFRGTNDNRNTHSEMTPIWNSFALFNHNNGNSGQYALAGTKLNMSNNEWQPNGSGQSQYFHGRGDIDFRMGYRTPQQTDVVRLWQVHEYVYCISTPFGDTISAKVKWSDYAGTTTIASKIPDALRRKYTTITGAYKEKALINSMTTLAEAAANKDTIWLKYTVNDDIPFEALSASGSYLDARWYTIRMNDEDQYIVRKDGSNFICGGGSNSDIHQGENSAEAQVAFMGDPYELKVLSRAACEANSANRYIGCSTGSATGTQLSVQTGASDISSWEMIYELGYDETMLLRQFNSTAGYWGWNYGSSNNPPAYSTSAASRIKVVELDKKDYVYHVIDSVGNVAVKMTEAQDVGTPLRLKSIPELIRSPFLALPGVNIFYYWSKEDYKADSTAVAGGGSRTRYKTNASYIPATEGNDIYVTYTGMGAALASTRVHFHTDQFFNVVLNGQYLYYSGGNINSKYPISNDEAGSNPYKWRLEGKDPYNMKVYNEGAHDANSSKAYINTTFEDEAALTFDAAATAARFVALSGTMPNSFEVMAATGDTLDVATNYYHIGRKTDNSVKMYDNTEAHGYASIRFMLTLTTANAVYYHLIDKNRADLLQIRSRYESLYFPSDYRSPMVVRYHYYPTQADALAGTHELTENTSIASLISATAIGDKDGDGYPDVYITYDTSDAYDLQNKRVMYLLKFETGTPFHPEDGKDGLETSLITPVYPYCNGDCNFFVYGQAQFDLQQEGAASTRTRWAWFLESSNNDPYHVKICSRQTETFNNNQARAYFRTYVESFGDAEHIVTTLTWPDINSITGTEYMVLGAVGQFQLVTTDSLAVDLNGDSDTSDANEAKAHRAVNSFEQYWKTWDTVRKKVLGDSNAKASQTDPNTVPATPATAVATAAGKNNRTYLTDIMHWHSYEHWAYAKRWNGYNISGATAKGWEPLEHWYQTVAMGEGYFDLVPISIDPALILLDQHGWEIMRKPLPNSADDPDKEAKHAALREYDSPMVKEYHFWTKASKRTGFHQYYALSQRINYTSTSLGSLPPIESTYVKDAKGNVLDQYVTYVVKDEYVKSLGKPFLIQQGDKFASYTGSELTKTAVPSGGMSQYIVTNATNLTEEGSLNTDLWYIKPNDSIDVEMGYHDVSHDWTNDYTVTDFSEKGFDPYNIQISSVKTVKTENADTIYFMTNATGANLVDGVLEGVYTSDPAVTTGSADANVSCMWYDSRRLTITDKTFMVVSDANGNMQLMPRFDQTKRMKDFSRLVSSSDAEIEKTYTQLFRPQIYHYRIIDNAGNEALRYQSGGDLVPQTPEWFKSQLAKDFVYYANKTLTDTIKASLEGASLNDDTVYVRYSYDEDADWNKVLQGKWLTMTLGGKDAVYNSGLKEGSSKPDPVDGAHLDWQWKFLATPQSDPDPYAVSLYNRSQSGATTVDTQTKFALLSWYDNTGIDPNAYTLLVAGTKGYAYYFVNGSGMTTSVAADTTKEAGVTGAACSYTAGAKVVLNDDVQHTYTYKVYTNGNKFAVRATQTQGDAISNDYVPILPEEIQSPLLHTDQFIYYDRKNLTLNAGEAEITAADTTGKSLKNLYGLYDDSVYVRYSAYDVLTTEYQVPNVKTTVDSKVARGSASNDAALDINGELIYNIVWYDDNMMASNNTNVTDGGVQDLTSDDAYVWQFLGNDPYAIQIKHKKSDKYAVGTGTLAGSASSTFMLLPSSDDWQYGMLQVTGGTNMLSGYGQTTVSSDPTKFIIFGLSTFKVIYHLVMANVDSDVKIPYRATKGGTLSDTTIVGSTKRDLTSTTTVTGDTYQLGSTINGVTYSFDYGHVTLGDSLYVPDVFWRPNCKYFFFVEGVYTDPDCSRAIEYGTEGSHIAELDAQYRGLQVTRMGKEAGLLTATIRINIVYAFDDGLPSNTGSHFVTNTAGTEWYTFETSDETPYMANFTYKDNKLRGKEGRIGHYTNEFLWSPVGDPYGFVMYNRYVYKNGGEPDNVMTTASAPTADADLIMMDNDDTDYQVYELLAGTSSGNFKVQTLTVPESGTPYYIDNHEGTIKLKTSSTTEWHFGLDQTLFDPYVNGAGNVGGLTTTPKAGRTKSGVELYKAATNLMEKQAVVYNPDNIVDFTPGYYRIFSQPNSQGIKTPRYLSGYTHLVELTGDGELTHAAIPMHFYETSETNTTYEVLGSGYTLSHATRGAIPITGPEYDPASIFYITSASGNAPYTMQTQGLYVDSAVMATSAGSNSNFYVADIGGATVLIHNGATPAERKYFHYRQSVGNIYDVKFETGSVVDEDDAAKWCMEPANKKGLWIETHSGGEEATLSTLWYYATICVPFDLMISNKDDDPEHSSNAYTCVPTESAWDGEMLHPKPIGKYTNSATDSTYYDVSLRKRRNPKNDSIEYNDYFVPAGTPVIFSTKRATSYIKATIPTDSLSRSIETIFSAKYLEQLLPGWDNSKRVYVFGPKMEGTLTLNTSDGSITTVLPSLGNTNVGFHLNANPNKELGLTSASWTRNNYYVLHNKIYYKDGSNGASAPSKDLDFIPVQFSDDHEDQQPDEGQQTTVGDGCVYDILGRKVATGVEVLDGSWRYRLQPGIYIVDGQKVYIQ